MLSNHPDKGGDHAYFVKIMKLYKSTNLSDAPRKEPPKHTKRAKPRSKTSNDDSNLDANEDAVNAYFKELIRIAMMEAQYVKNEYVQYESKKVIEKEPPKQKNQCHHKQCGSTQMKNGLCKKHQL